MPEISRFLGIVITMYFNDHEPANFHRFELRRNWTLLVTDGKVRRIAPLV